MTSSRTEPTTRDELFDAAYAYGSALDEYARLDPRVNCEEIEDDARVEAARWLRVTRATLVRVARRFDGEAAS